MLWAFIVATPIVGSASGWFWSSSPKIGSENVICSSQQKDSFGRCPPPGRSNFRYLSTGSGGGRSGSGGGGGK